MSIYVCVVYEKIQKFVQKVQIIQKKSKISKSQKNSKNSKNPKKFKKLQKSKNSTNPKKIEFFIFFYFFIFSFWNNFFSLWNLEDLRKPHRVNPGGIGFLFFSSFFWHIKRIFSTSYAKVMAVLRFFSGFCKKGQNSYFKISIRTRQ